MTKADLKTGMLVETRNGNRYLVCRNTYDGEDIFIRREGYMPFSKYNDDLFNNGCNKGYDVMKVYCPIYYSDIATILEVEPTKLTCIYNREKVRELSIEQIEELLGYSVKIVKE